MIALIFWEDDSIVNRDILVGNHRDSSLFEDGYDSFKFLENESYDLGREELIREGDITSLYSEKENGDSFRQLEWANENRECEKEMMDKEGIFTFNLFEELEGSDITSSVRIWSQPCYKIDKGGKKYDNTKEEDTTLGESLGVFETKRLTIIYLTLLLFRFEFKDVLHLGAFLEAKVHGTLGKVPKSVCLAG